MPYSPQPMTEWSQPLRRTFDLAVEAHQRGDEPFGALLWRHGETLLEARNAVQTTGDPTQHAELRLLQRASRLPAEELRGAVLVTSTEPCVMCTGAAYWFGLQRVLLDRVDSPSSWRIVYGCGARRLAEHLGESFALPCRKVLAAGGAALDVVGPLLEDEAFAVHANAWQPSRYDLSS